MTRACLLNLDVGTSSLKASLYDTSGDLVAQESVGYTYQSPDLNWAEQNPLDWWDACKSTCRKITQVTGCHILAIHVSGQAPGCVPIDRSGSPVRPAILWPDRRSVPQVQWLEQHLGLERAIQTGRNTLDSYFGGVKWLWFQQNEAELYNATWKILQVNGYLVFRLTGEAVTDPSHAGICSPCFDFQNLCWSKEICSEIGIDLDKLPEISPSTEVVGVITTAAARDTGIPVGTPVVCGAADFVCAHLGSGAIEPGTASMMLGTAGNLMALSSHQTDPRMLNTVYITREIISTGGVLAGSAVRWFAEMLQIEQPSLYEILDREAAGVAPGAGNLVFLPHLIGARSPIWDAEARGVYFGLSASHQRSHLYRAVLEGVAYGFRQLLEIFSANGTSIQQVVAINGGARSALWRQILADVMGVPLLWRPKKDGTSLGGACIAALGLGILSNPAEISGWLEPVVETPPETKNSRAYRHLYAVYADLYERLKDLFPELEKHL